MIKGTANASDGRYLIVMQDQHAEVLQLLKDVHVDVLDTVFTEIQSDEVVKRHGRQFFYSAVGEVEPDDVEVVHEVIGRHARVPSIQEAQFGMKPRLKGQAADKGEALTETPFRAAQMAEAFVVVLGTLENAVTHVSRVNTHHGRATAVEAGAAVAATFRFILVVRAVEHAVAAQVDRQAVGGLPGAAEVGVRAVFVLGQAFLVEVPVAVEEDDGRGR